MKPDTSGHLKRLCAKLPRFFMPDQTTRGNVASEIKVDSIATNAKWLPFGSHLSLCLFHYALGLIVPIMEVVAPDDDRAIGVAIVPSTVPAIVVPIESRAIIVAIVAVTAHANVDAKSLSACHSRRCHCEGRKCGENIGKFHHAPLSS